MSLDLGQPAPLFTLNDAHGTHISLEALRGQWVVLYFYPRDNTPGCTKEACGFRDRYADFQTHSIQVLGISTDDATAHQKFSRKYELPFPLLCDPEGVVAQAYGSYGPKQFMGKTYEGVYRHTFVIDPTGKIAKIYRKVKPEAHGELVFQDLTKLLALPLP